MNTIVRPPAPTLHLTDLATLHGPLRGRPAWLAAVQWRMAGSCHGAWP